VIDDGQEVRHEDLAANVIVGGGKNFVDGSNDPTPTSYADAHGTAVSGIIAAAGWNGKGGRGVAPEAQLKGFNFLASDADPNDQDANIRYAWGGGLEAKDVQVFNNSWGSAGSAFPAMSAAETRSWEKLMSAARSGRGGVYVKSAGNSFDRLLYLGLLDICRKDTIQLGVSCALNNVDPLNNLTNIITVAAVNARGIHSSYSSAGTATWVAGLGGEYGLQRAYLPDYPDRVYDPAIVSTDLMGCSRGDNEDIYEQMPYRGPANALDTSASAIDASCNYTAIMNGTSAAAPTVAGVASLMLGVNPRLSGRDVKYILAATARPIDLLQPKAVYQGTVIEPGWITNAAGHRYSSWYGFGLVDATAAVARARSFKPLPAEVNLPWKASTDPAQTIPAVATPNHPAELTVKIVSDVKIEAVQFSFQTTHTSPRSLLGMLISPSGTKSYVQPAFTTLGQTPGGFAVDLSSSNAFLDEPAKGTWRLQLTDLNSATAGKAKLQSFQLHVVGH